jgi:hypothetical protein
MSLPEALERLAANKVKGKLALAVDPKATSIGSAAAR